jgi:uncharacterized damage-inducible protein DinB
MLPPETGLSSYTGGAARAPEELLMKMMDLFGATLEREAAVSRRVLERAPEGRQDWKPHEKSMPLGYLATLVATMPSWIAMAIDQDALDLAPPGGQPYRPQGWTTTRDLLQALEGTVSQARTALSRTSEEHLATPWRLLQGGRVVMENPRHVVIADTFTHMAHHRGQLSVYLRLCGSAVPSMYGPSADERHFA